jgi:hypothetical protein
MSTELPSGINGQLLETRVSPSPENRANPNLTAGNDSGLAPPRSRSSWSRLGSMAGTDFAIH